jgi:F-type H+-transporting ATPase subunit c
VRTKLLLLATALFALASPVFAQGGAPATAGSDTHFWIWITSGFAMAIASAVCGLAQAKAISSACEGIARNPGAAGSIQVALFVGLALIESLALYTLVIVFLKVG